MHIVFTSSLLLACLICVLNTSFLYLVVKLSDLSEGKREGDGVLRKEKQSGVGAIKIQLKLATEAFVWIESDSLDCLNKGY